MAAPLLLDTLARSQVDRDRPMLGLNRESSAPQAGNTDCPQWSTPDIRCWPGVHARASPTRTTD